jgi:hypothetical protein
MKKAESRARLGFLHFDSNNGGDIFLRNVGFLSVDYMVLYPSRYNSSGFSMVAKFGASF